MSSFSLLFSPKAIKGCGIAGMQLYGPASVLWRGAHSDPLVCGQNAGEPGTKRGTQPLCPGAAEHQIPSELRGH